MINLLREGTMTRTGRDIVEEGERLGARLSMGAGLDRTRVSLSALGPNLDASLALMADVIRNPRFDVKEIERLRAIQLTAIAQEEANPNGLAQRALYPLVYGESHPYAAPRSGQGTAAGVKVVSRDDLLAFHQAWIRPENLQLVVVGDVTPEQLIPALERAFGDWKAPAAARGKKALPAPARPTASRILLIDRPNSPQSLIAAGQLVPQRGADDPVDLRIANEALGGSFTSRLNTDLRETKGWSYGVRSGVPLSAGQMAFTVFAPVQADKTGPSLKALVDNIKAFAGPEPVTPADLQRTINSNVYALPGEFETSGAVLAALEAKLLYDRPDDYYEKLIPRYRALDQAAITAATRKSIDPERLQWVVVGDAKIVRPQLEALGLPFEVRPAAP
jgi:predicted Zn-dependent peptidase